MIFDDIDRPVTQEHARVELGVLLDEIGDNQQNIQPAEVRRLAAASVHAGLCFVDDRLDRMSKHSRLT
jgi:hypothetical protein